MENSLCEDDRKTSLRDRIKKSMGKEIHVPWSTMPEVQSSGLLETLPENQLKLEELKFCLITCEVAFNIEIADLVNLCKRSVSWSDPLPAFNRRTISSTVEKIKRCSDGFLNQIEKYWNVKPMLSIVTLCKILADMAPQLENFITFCTHQEDLRTVFCNAMRSKPEVAIASFSNRMNVERTLLPLQHLKLLRYLLQDIRSELISMKNHLENFHCRRALTDVTKLLDECYKTLVTLHGQKYVERLERLLDESVHCCDMDYYKKFCYEINKQHKKTTEKSIIHKTSSTNSSSRTKCNKSNQSTKTSESENKSRAQSVTEHCKYFSLYFIDINNNSEKQLPRNRLFKSEKSKLKRQKPVQGNKKNNFQIAEKHRPKSSPLFNDRLSKIEILKKNNNNLDNGNNFSAESKFILSSSDVDRVSESKQSDSEKNNNLHEHIYSTLEDINSYQDAVCVSNEIKLRSEQNYDHFTEISSQRRCEDGLSSDVKTEKSCFGNESKFISDSEVNNCNTILPSSNPIPQSDTSVKLMENSANINVTDKGETSAIISESKSLSDCDNSRSTNSVTEDNISSFKTVPLEMNNISVEILSLEDELKISRELNNADRFRKENSVASLVKDDEPDCTPKRKNDAQSLYEDISATGSSIEKSEELKCEIDFPNNANKMNDSFISSYDFGHTDVPENYLLTQANNESHEDKIDEMIYENDENIYENDEPTFSSFKRKHNSISPSKYKKKMGSEYESETRQNDPIRYPLTLLSVSNSFCAHEYEDVDMCDSKMRSSSILSNCEDVPLYQAYKYRDVEGKKSGKEEHLYIEPDEHVYEDIDDYMKNETQINMEKSAPNMEISKPSGSSERVRWIDIMEVVNSGLPDKLDNNQIALQEAKYEVITSEASYFKSLIILDAIFISDSELKDILTESEYATLFSDALKVKRCSQAFLVALLEGWQNDLMLNYLCNSISKFLESGAFQVYVDSCANQMNINKTLEYLRLKNPAFVERLSKLEHDPVCQSFTIQSFLTMPMQRVTRLPLLVEAILKRLSADLPEYHSWKSLLYQLQEVANECNEAIGKADKETVIEYEQLRQMNEKIMTLNMKHSHQKKRPHSFWNLFKIKK